MSSPTKTKADFLELALKSGLVTQSQIDDLFDSNVPADPNAAANQLLKAGIITQYQAKQLLAGKFRGYFLGTYKILQPIGQGGMGSVFLAEHTSLQRRVAIKVLTAEKAKDKLTLERFNREARAAAALDHPNIVRLHDISQGNGVHFLVMEYVEGNDLHSLMSKTGPLHYAQAVEYIAQVAAGLQHAHDRGFIHRDIKPANLMLNKDGHVKILDMGLARNFNSSSDNLTALLAEGNIAGTVDFLSPEQAMNHPLDERSDIYSLGATLYALLTGHPPFNGSTAQKLMQHQLKDPPSLMKKLNGRVPPPLSEVLNKMMAKKPSERFQSGSDVIDALAPWLPARTTGDIIQDANSNGAMSYSQSTRNVMKSKAKAKSKTKDIMADGTALPLWQRKPVIIGAGVLVLGVIGGLCAMLFSGPKIPDVAKNPYQQPNVPNGNSNPTPPSPAPNNGTKPPTNTNRVNSPRLVPSALTGWALIHKEDFSKVPAVQKTTNYQEAFGGSNIKNVAPGWQYEVYDKESNGEFIAGSEEGQPYIGIAARNGGAASQITFQPGRTDSIVFKNSVTYLVNFEYQCELTGGSSVNVQTVSPFKPVTSTTLANSKTWKKSNFEFTMPDEAKVQVVFRSNAISKESFLKIRNIEYFEKAAPAKSLVSFKASDLKPFDTKSREGGMAAEWPGWFCNVYDTEVVGRYIAKDLGDGMVLGVGVESGAKNAAQLMYRAKEGQHDFFEENKTYTVKVVYKTDRGSSGFVNIQSIGDWQIVVQENLSDTDGAWKTVTIPYTRPTGKDVQLVVGPGKPDGKFVWIRSVEIFNEAPMAIAPQKKELIKIDAGTLGKRLMTYDVKFDQPGTVKFQDGAAMNGKSLGLPNDISVFCWKKTSVAEFRVGTVEGSSALGVMNLNDDLSSQMNFALPSTVMQKGKRYVARIEYLTKNDAVANFVSQFGKEYKRGASIELPVSNDVWTTASLSFECLNSSDSALLLESQTVGEGTLVYVRKLELFEE